MGAGSSVPSKRKLQSIIFLKLYNNDRSVTVKQRLYQAFDETDVSGDGLIQRDEFADVIDKLGLTVDDQKCGQIFNVFDADSSGTIDRNEFLNFMGYSLTSDDIVEKRDKDVQKMMKEQQIDDCALRLDVYRKLAGIGTVFVGQAGYERARLLDFPENISTKVEQSLREKPDLDVNTQRLVGGDLQYRVTRMSVLKIKIVKAQGLAKADLLGKSDPYVVVKMNNEERHKTTVIKKCLNPVWDNESLSVALPTSGKKLAKSVLKVEVYDKDMVGSEFLGRVTIKGEDLLKEGQTPGEKGYDLVGEEGTQTKKQKGTITLELSHTKQIRIVVAEVRKLVDPATSQIKDSTGGMWAEAVDEANTSTTLSKLSCNVLWKGQTIGKTAEVDATGQSGEWLDHATFMFPYEN